MLVNLLQPFPRADRTADIPLSFSQTRLWFLDRFSPGDPTYNTPILVDFRGPLNVETLRRALSDIVRRHEALRTTFPSRRGVPRQAVLPYEPQTLPLVDLMHLDPAGRDAQLDTLIAEDVRQPFNLEHGPIFRTLLVRLKPEHHVLIGGVHHIVFDGWSNGILFREITAVYAAFAAGSPSPIPELPVQFVDYVALQRERLKGGSLPSTLNYWKARLDGAPRLTLPTDFPRPKVRSLAGSREFLELPEELVSAVDALGRREGATLFVTLLTAYACLLQAFCRQDDLIIGTPIANRPRKELESVIGFFLNMLPLRLNLSGQPTFREALQRTKEVAFSAYAHQDLPFEKLVEELRPERSLDRSPVIETVFVLDNNPHSIGETIASGDLTLCRRVAEPGTAKFDLGLLIFRTDGGRRVALEFRRDLFERDTAVRLLRQYARLLRNLVVSPDATLATLLLDDTDVSPATHARHTIYPRTSTLFQQVEEHARRRPDAPALVSDDIALSYSEFNRRANQLARLLRNHGVTPGDRVGLCLERSVETIVTLLAIVKCGASYVPLDPAYPRARLALMTDRSSVATVVTTSALADITGISATRLIRLDLERDRLADYDDADLDVTVSAEDLAYVLFTSGSTGDPKMVGVPHRAITRLAYGMPDVPTGPGARVLHAAPLGFDASTFEIWSPLLRCGCVVISPYDLPTPDQLEQCVRGSRVTVLWLTSSLFNLVIDERPEALASVGFVLAGGEALSVEHVERALAALPDTTIVNGYGPTEATTFATYYPIPPEAPRRPTIPIGRPLDNTLVYILDEARQVVGPGFPGEIWIGGDALAVGYVDDPALTGERFVPDPFAGGLARMYRTGDRGRYLSDGTIEFLGRLDAQIKIRGFRIEPAEIESALIGHPGVDRAAVAVHDLPGLGQSLVGYVVPVAPDAPPTTSELRAFLRMRLPQHMVPTFFEVLATLPLSLNGKLDRRSLRPPTSTARPLSVSPDTVPLTSAERVVADVWRELLAMDSIGRDASFFELGGDSLRAAQVMSRLSEAAGASLAVRSIFEFPTVAGLAKILESHEQSLAHEARRSRAEAGAEPGQSVQAVAKPSDPGDGNAFASGELETVLADIWRSVLRTASSDIDADFFEIGGHSLLAVRLVWEVESRLGVALPPASLFQHGTIRKQAQLLREPGSELAWSPLVAIQPNGTKPPLFLVHGIGGEVLSYGPLATHLGQDQPLYGLRARANVESGTGSSVEAIAASYVAAVRRRWPGPYHIGGYSGGGLIAYEMAQQLRRAGQEVSLLLLDCSAPNSMPLTRPSLRDYLGLFVRAVHWFSDDDLLRAGSAVALGRLRSKLFGVVSAVARRMSPNNAPEPDIRHELGLWRYPDDSRGFLAQLNKALRAYRPAPYSGSMTVVRARSRRLWSLRKMPEDLGWSPLVGGRLRTELVPAAHDTLVTEPRVRQTAKAVRQHLESDGPCGEVVSFQPTGELATATED